MSETQKKEQAVQTVQAPEEAEKAFKQCWSCLIPMNEETPLKHDRMVRRCPKCGRVNLESLR